MYFTRIEVAKMIGEAKSYGDLSENSEYDAAKTKEAQEKFPRAQKGGAKTAPPGKDGKIFPQIGKNLLKVRENPSIINKLVVSFDCKTK